MQYWFWGRRSSAILHDKNRESGDRLDWEEYFSHTAEMAEGAKQRILQDEARIHYVNARYQCYGQKESEWLYNVEFWMQEGQLVIEEKETGKMVRLAENRVEYLKLRPFYFAICVGFKNFIFYAHPQAEENR